MKKFFSAAFCLILAAVFLIQIGPSNAEAPKPTPTPDQSSNIVYAGVRSSIYGIDPFPTEAGWGKAMTTMADYFPGSTPAAIWIVGALDGDTTGIKLEFPSDDGKTYPLIGFSEEDRHESYLNYFDEHGIKVYLQVEPGFAGVPTLIDLVLKHYGQHPCVVGFGVDVEWYQNASDAGDTMGIPVTDDVAEAWEKQVQSYNENYQLFLKHWDLSYMPPTYRGTIVFVDDSQIFESIDPFLEELKVWSDTFYPNMVMFQYGYESDQPWWSQMDNPVKEIGEALAQNTRQSVGLIWVDFTLKDVLPVE